LLWAAFVAAHSNALGFWHVATIYDYVLHADLPPAL